MNKIKTFKYQLQSYVFTFANRPCSSARFLFTIIEPGHPGELHQYTQEIMSSDAWENYFSCADIQKITYAAQLEKEEKEKNLYPIR